MKKVTLSKRKKHSRNKKLFGIPKSFIYAFISTVITLTAAIISILVFFKISTVEIVGQTQYAYKDILVQSQITTGENMFSINKFAIIDNLKIKFPYLNKVSIRRTLPGTITISVNDSSQFACLQNGTDYWIIDEQGKLLQQTDEAFFNSSALVRIKGLTLEQPTAGLKMVPAQDSQDNENSLFNILHTLKFDDILVRINEIDVTRLYQITMIYDNRLTVCLGTIDDLERKLKFFNEVNLQLSSNDNGTVDVSSLKKARFIPKEN